MADDRRMDIRHDAPEAYRALAALTRAASTEHRLAELIKVRISQINGCAYCIDLHIGLARTAGEAQRRLDALVAWRESAFFTDAERAALALAEGLTLLSHGPVPEELYAEAAPPLRGPRGRGARGGDHGDQRLEPRDDRRRRSAAAHRRMTTRS